MTQWTAALQSSLPFTIPPSFLKLMSIESMMPSNHLILCHPFPFLPSVFPNIKVFFNESALCTRWPNGASASASVLPMKIQGWFPLGWTGLITLLFKKLSRVFSSIVTYINIYIYILYICIFYKLHTHTHIHTGYVSLKSSNTTTI